MSEPAEAPLIGAIREKLDGHEGPFAMFVNFFVEAGREDEFVAAFVPATTGTRAEARNLRYELNRGRENPNHFILYERWPDLAALVTHSEQPHYKALGEAIGPMLTDAIDIDVYAALDVE